MTFKNDDELERLDRRLNLEDVDKLLSGLDEDPNEYPLFSITTKDGGYLGIITNIEKKRKYVYITVVQASGTEEARILIEDFENGEAWISTKLLENPKDKGFILKNPDGNTVKTKDDINESTYLAKKDKDRETL